MDASPLPISTFDIEEVARLPLPGMAYPGSLAFRPGGGLISYLFSPQGSLVRQLYQFDLQTGATRLLMHPPESTGNEEDFSNEERLRRERQRQYELGITQYQWSNSGDLLLLPLIDGLYLAHIDHQQEVDAELPALTRLVDNQNGPLLDPQFSPDGHWVAYVQQGELWVVSCEGTLPPHQLTQGGDGNAITHGLAEYIAQEEMGRSHGYWWSPDSRLIAFEEVDQSHIPLYRIMHQGKEFTGEMAQEDHAYPFAGAANAYVRLGVVHLDGGEATWMDLGKERDIYLARVDWLPDGRLAAQLENRAQSELYLLFFDPASGVGQRILTEANPLTERVWINLNNLFKTLKGGRFLWGSERSGFQHLYLYDAQGNLLRQLTGGDWMVESVAGVDEENGQVYFTGTRDSPLETHLYAVGLAGGPIQRITQAPGMHNVVLDIPNQRFIDTHDHLNQPPTVTLRSLVDDQELGTIFRPDDPRIGDLGLTAPEIIRIANRSGTALYGAIYRPGPEFGPPPYATIVAVYGGPHAQQVSLAWRMTAAMRAQYLRSLGFLVFVLDNRGSARRGLEFESALRHNMGDVEVQDQVDGVRWLVAQGLADPARVGIYGWSYGGYMTLMCLARAPETFRCGVAGAPVTNWDGYDTHYTERYMGTPQVNPQGYQQSAVSTHVDNLRGKLLLVHGLIDENVHFRHTARLINALIKARKPYELLLFPDERHGPRSLADRVYLEERIRDFFVTNLSEV